MNELATLVCQWKIDIMYIFRCPVCGWPMCNSKCAKASVHRYWIGIIAYHRLPFANIFLTVDRKCTIVHCTYIWLDVAIFKWKHCFQGSGVQNIQGEGEKSWLFRLGFWGATSKNMVKCTVCKKEIMVFFFSPLLQKKAFKYEFDWFDVAIYKPTNILSENSECPRHCTQWSLFWGCSV